MPDLAHVRSVVPHVGGSPLRFPGRTPRGTPRSARPVFLPVLVACALTTSAYAQDAAAQTSAPERAVVNAPVAPDTIYVARGGARTGISVVDLNGFGQSTGNPAFSVNFGPGSEGQSKFPFNPNLAFTGSLLVPPLAVGTTTLDGGSAGVFTLTLDSELDDLLVEAPRIGAVGDMMLGAPLDIVFNNSVPFGCQAGGGNVCAATGLKAFDLGIAGPNTLTPNASSPLVRGLGFGNAISFAPHPNPPPLVLPPTCANPLILGQEPTSVATGLPLPFGPGLVNLLVPGSLPLGNPALGIPPDGLLAREQNAFFQGPSPPSVSVAACNTYSSRQQIGHFLYTIDPLAGVVRILNSNTFAELGSVAVEDPVELAMGPNLDLLAVTSRATDSVVFIDIDPASSRFHQVVNVTAVGRAPRGIAWDPGNEDVLVCNEGDSTLSIISVFDLRVRKTIASGLRRPFAVAVTPRQDAFGARRNVYYAYVLERSGRVGLFESGPGGINGWGYDDIVAFTPFRFRRPKAIQPDPTNLDSGVWIAHEVKLDAQGRPELDGGALSNLALVHDQFGQLPLGSGAPGLRGSRLELVRSIGRGELTGVPVDIAFDNQRNLGALPASGNPFSAGAPAPINGKQLVRTVSGVARATSAPALLFLAVETPSGGAIDVLDLASGARVDTNPYRSGVQSIPTPGVRGLMDYFRQ